MKKDYFMFRASWMASIDAIPTEKTKAEMALAIIRYAFKGEEYDGQNVFIKTLIPTIIESINKAEKKSAIGKEYGKMGGNPLLTQKRVNPTLNPTLNGTLNPTLFQEREIETETKKTEEKKNQEKNNKEIERKDKEERKEYFADCWVAYRRKGSKKKAYEYWNKLTAKEQDKVLPHIKAYVATRELNYQKDFERYLRDRTFLDIVTNDTGNVIYDPTDVPELKFEPMPETTSKYQ